MSKNKIHIEHELRSNSQSIIWHLISTAEGLSRWLADDVREDGNSLTLTWGETWSHHEIKTASVLEEARGEYIRYSWENGIDEDDFWELRIEKSDITGDYILIITDHALPEDIESLESIWESNLEQLHHTTGL